jgi:phage shock protein PspC (stress-responsive transcriptional regulator)
MTATPPPDPSPVEPPPPAAPSPLNPPSWQQAPPAPPVPAAAGRQRPPLRRSATDKVLGGVCGGLAEYSGVEPLLWRVGFIALAFFGPGILIYPLLWLLMPAGPTGPDHPADPGFTQRLRKGLTPKHPDS